MCVCHVCVCVSFHLSLHTHICDFRSMVGKPMCVLSLLCCVCAVVCVRVWLNSSVLFVCLCVCASVMLCVCLIYMHTCVWHQLFYYCSLGFDFSAHHTLGHGHQIQHACHMRVWHTDQRSVSVTPDLSVNVDQNKSIIHTHELSVCVYFPLSRVQWMRMWFMMDRTFIYRKTQLFNMTNSISI